MRRTLTVPAGLAGVLALSVLTAACSSSSTPSAAASSSLTGSAAASGTAAPATITIGLPNSTPSFANSDVAVAQAEGFFKQVGLTVKADNLSSGVPVVQGVVGGSLQIGASSIEPVVNAAAAGAGITVIGSYADKLTVDLVTGKDITSAAGLRGKRVGIQQVGAFREVMTRMAIESAGLTRSDVTYVPSSSSAYISELLAGQIQSGVLQEEQTLKALGKDKNLHVLLNYEQAFPDYFYGAYVVSKSWLSSPANEVTAGKFLAAITLAHRFMYSHKPATVAIIAKNTGYPTATITKAYQALLTREQAVPVNSGLDTARIADTIATMKKYQILTGTAPSATSLVNPSIIDGVIQNIGTAPGKPLSQ
jgi:ABC-type nitrate/sulfonate/bicarbonate transport system substrate-binding protein